MSPTMKNRRSQGIIRFGITFIVLAIAGCHPFGGEEYVDLKEKIPTAPPISDPENFVLGTGEQIASSQPHEATAGRDPFLASETAKPEPGSPAADFATQAQQNSATAHAMNSVKPGTGSAKPIPAPRRNPNRPISAIDDLFKPGQPLRIENDEPEEPREIQLLVKEKSFRTEGPESALRVNYDDLDLLKILNMQPVPANAISYFPAWLKNLNGKRIRIRGFMYPAFEQTGLDHFVLARDNDVCCFVREPLIYDVIGVRMRPGKTTDYIANRPFDVVGTLRMDLLMADDKPFGLWFLDDALVIAR